MHKQRHLLKPMMIVTTTGALCNKYRPPLSSGDEENDLQTAAKMRHLSTQTNLLQTEVESNNLQKKRYVWRKIDDENIDIPDFPQYTEEEIRELTLGVYQVKLAKHYTQEHMSQEGHSRVNLELSKNWLDSVCDAAIIPEVAEVVDESDSESEAMEE
uniref:Uncharacterized protein n=1 Tax=Magallana gigas TaxID=29159 RepID=A0A8W8P4F1_MAGGI